MRFIYTCALSMFLGLASGCVGELEPLPAGGVGGGADASTGNPQARTFYDSNIAPMMTAARPKGTCAACHQGVDPINGPDFLGANPASGYTTLIGNPRLVNTASPATSVLITRGDHAGDAFCTGVDTPYAGCTVNEVDTITQWITMVGM